MKSFVINEFNLNKNITNIILKMYPHLNINTLNKAFRKGDIKVNKKSVDKNYSSNLGDIIYLYIKDELLYNVPTNIDIVYEDDNLLVVYKPRGVISCHNKIDKSSKDLIYLDDIVKEYICANARICHRLDTNTEGLVIFSKNSNSYNEILNVFKEGKIYKSYICLVYSKPQKIKDTTHGYILEDINTGYSKVYKEKVNNSSYISTSYELIEYIEDLQVSILRVQIHTGKTHQIRSHMKFLNTPIIGDSKYTPQNINKMFKLKYQVLYASTYCFNFDKCSSLYYLNNKAIDISNDVIKKIKMLLNV